MIKSHIRAFVFVLLSAVSALSEPATTAPRNAAGDACELPLDVLDTMQKNH